MRSSRFGSHAATATLFVLAALLLTPRTASAQYTAQVLIPPDPFPPTTPTDGFAINSRGQVFGDVRSGPVRTPVLWTTGVPLALTLPDPTTYSWDGHGGEQFLNDSGTVISNITSPSDLPGHVLNQILRWRPGMPPDFVPPTPPSTMSPPSCSLSYEQFTRWG
jgi:hypothetical protein